MIMDKRNFALGRTNFILLALGAAIVLIGFVLMGSTPSSETAFNPEVFSTLHIKVAPVVCFIGYISMIFGVLYRKSSEE